MCSENETLVEKQASSSSSVNTGDFTPEGTRNNAHSKSVKVFFVQEKETRQYCPL